jgi:hypothetical protein
VSRRTGRSAERATTSPSSAAPPDGEPGREPLHVDPDRDALEVDLAERRGVLTRRDGAVARDDRHCARGADDLIVVLGRHDLRARAGDPERRRREPDREPGRGRAEHGLPRAGLQLVVDLAAQRVARAQVDGDRDDGDRHRHRRGRCERDAGAKAHGSRSA